MRVITSRTRSRAAPTEEPGLTAENRVARGNHWSTLYTDIGFAMVAGDKVVAGDAPTEGALHVNNLRA